MKEVCKVTGLGRSFIYQLQTENRFPHSIKIGARAVGWLEDEVRTWLADRVAASRSGKKNGLRLTTWSMHPDSVTRTGFETA
jgi:prophage regulatory protein